MQSAFIHSDTAFQEQTVTFQEQSFSLLAHLQVSFFWPNHGSGANTHLGGSNKLNALNVNRAGSAQFLTCLRQHCALNPSFNLCSLKTPQGPAVPSHKLSLQWPKNPALPYTGWVETPQQSLESLRRIGIRSFLFSMSGQNGQNYRFSMTGQQL